MKHLPRKAITSTPELANRAPFPVVIDAFLVGAANYTIGHYDGERTMFLDKFHNFLANAPHQQVKTAAGASDRAGKHRWRAMSLTV
jgi:hypothetical protein